VATLTVWKFDTTTGAEEAESTLESLSKQQLIKVHDAAVFHPELIRTSLSDEEEAKLREAFAED
jgi:uncharacterized membrane protein